MLINLLRKFRKLSKLDYIYNLRKYITDNPSDIYYVHELSGLIAVYLATMTLINEKRFKVIYDAHEYEIYRNPPYPFFVRLIVRYIENVCVRSLDARIVTVSNTIADLYAQRFDKSCSVIRNLPSPPRIVDEPMYQCSRLVDLAAETINAPDPFVLRNHAGQLSAVIVGKIMLNRGIEEVLNALAMDETLRLNLFLIGEGDMDYMISIKEKVRSLNLEEKVYWIRPVANEQLIPLLSRADFSIIPIIPLALSYYACAPNKLFESIASQLPICYNGAEHSVLLRDVDQIVNSLGVGAPVNFLNRSEAVIGLRNFIENYDKYKIKYEGLVPLYYSDKREQSLYEKLLDFDE